MISPNTQRMLIASANVRPARILVLSASAEETAAEATGTTLPLVGVSVNAGKFPYGSYEYTAVPYTAETGDAIAYRGPGQVCQVLSGAAISALATPLTSDGSGRAITATAEGQYCIGFSLDTAAAANELIRVAIQAPFKLGA